MTSVHINPGICGLPTKVTANSEDGQTVSLSIQSSCPNIQLFADKLTEVDAFEVCFARFSESPVYQAMEKSQAGDKNFRHAACPVPSGIIKAVECAAGLALPAKVEFEIEKS